MTIFCQFFSVKRFEEGCPSEIISALVEQIAIWTDNSTFNSIIWNNENGPLLMEISRQACCLPIPQHVIIKQAIDVFKSILLVISFSSSTFS